MKKGNLRTSFIFLLVAFLVLFSTAALVANIDNLKNEDKITANTIKENTIQVNNGNTIQVQDSNQPVPNENEGTLVLWTKPPIEIFDQFSDARDYIIFFSATNIPGLRIVYNIRSHKFEAGMPLLSSPEIDIFDGQNHQLAYAFKRGSEQAIFLDGVKVNSSAFTPIDMSQITGLMIAVDTIDNADIAGVEVAVYDRYMSETDLNKIK